MWKNKYTKAVTFSYDDGVLQDERLVKILNKYHLKCTFNINTGLSRDNEPFYDHDVIVSHFNIDELVPLYHGHEVAIHSSTHPDLTELSETEVIYQIEEDKRLIHQYFGIIPKGMAYPYGTYNDKVVSVLKQCGVLYSRTVVENHDFQLQSDLLRFQPTAHHNDPLLSDLIDDFLNNDKKEDQILYIWGHSYEFDVDQNWDYFESICQKLSNHPDIFYGTNEEVLLP